MSKTPKSDKFLSEDWPALVSTVTKRMEAGKETYGDSSFEKTPAQLIGEVMQEIEDQVGWSAIQWAKMRQLLERVNSLKI